MAHLLVPKQSLLSSTLELFPNPATSQVLISYQLSKGASGLLFITDTYGKKLKSYGLKETEGGISVQTTGMANGLNYVVLQEGEIVKMVSKLVVMD